MGPRSVRTSSKAASTADLSDTSAMRPSTSAPEAVEFGGGRFQGSVVTIEEGNAVAVAGEPATDTEADTGRSSGNNGNSTSDGA